MYAASYGYGQGFPSTTGAAAAAAGPGPSPAAFVPNVPSSQADPQLNIMYNPQPAQQYSQQAAFMGPNMMPGALQNAAAMPPQS